MPHVVLEYGRGIEIKEDLQDLFVAISDALVEGLPTKMESCKFRAYKPKRQLIGGKADQEFIHLEIRILSGREKLVIERTGSLVIQTMKDFLEKHKYPQGIDLSLEIVELSPFYFKGETGV